MNPLMPVPACSACQTPLDANGNCPRCVPPEWKDHIDAVEFVRRRFRDWHAEGGLTDRQMARLNDRYEKKLVSLAAAANANEPFEPKESFPFADECWSCKEYVGKPGALCPSCGAPLADPGVTSLRYWRYLYWELLAHEESGELTLRQGA